MKKQLQLIAEKMLKIWFGLPIILANKADQDGFSGILMRTICKEMEQKSSYFVSYNVRAKKNQKIVSMENESVHAGSFAIIMQGHLIKKDKFTLETVKIYQKLFPGVLILVSTWNDEDLDYIEEIRQESSCEVILNEYPEHNGYFNLNYQTVTTVAGLKRAQELGKEFVFKTRCDYRFYKKGLLEYMYCLLLDYPCNSYKMKQKYRIIMTSGRNDDMFRPYFVGDQFNFGFIGDMLNLWDQEIIAESHDYKAFSQKREKEHFSWKEERKYTAVLTRRYVKKMTGRDIAITVAEYWDYVKDNLIFLSAKDVDAFWWKYDFRFEETEGNGEFYRNDSETKCLSYNWNFASWLNLYHGILNYEPWMEKISENNYF